MGCKRTIARISTIEYIKEECQIDFQQMGVDELISPEALAASEIQRLIDQSAFNNSYEFEGGALSLIGTTVGATAPFVGRSVKDAAAFFPDLHFMPLPYSAKAHNTLLFQGEIRFLKPMTMFLLPFLRG